MLTASHKLLYLITKITLGILIEVYSGSMEIGIYIVLKASLEKNTIMNTKLDMKMDAYSE